MSDSVHTVYWKNSMKITPMFSLSGYSRAAENTGFYCKELEMAFDAGVQINDMPAFICLTHLHNDHMCALNKMLIGNTKNPIIFIPDNKKFEELLVATLRFLYLSSKFIHPESDKGKDQKTRYPYQIIKLAIGQNYKFKETKGIDYYVEGLPSNHGVVSISFGIYETRRRCKPEFANLQHTDYVVMKKQGIEFTETYKYPIICYMSDTNYKPLISPNAKLIFQYPVVVIECTFFKNDDIKQAKKKNHIHWKQIEKIISEKKDIKFILIHFSKKYLWNEIKNFFDIINKQTPLINIILWLQTGIVDYTCTNIIANNQLNKINDSHLNEISSNYSNEINDNQLNEINDNQLNEINDNQLNEINDNQLNEINDYQLNEINDYQLNEISNRESNQIISNYESNQISKCDIKKLNR